MREGHGHRLGCSRLRIQQTISLVSQEAPHRSEMEWVLTGHSPVTIATLGFCWNPNLNNSLPWIPAPTVTALPFQFPGPVYFWMNLTSLKLWVLMASDPNPVDRPMKSWPVFRITSLTLFSRAKSIPALICSFFVAIITYSGKYPIVQVSPGLVVGQHVLFVQKVQRLPTWVSVAQN